MSRLLAAAKPHKSMFVWTGSIKREQVNTENTLMAAH